jgi:hypothetical protein
MSDINYQSNSKMPREEPKIEEKKIERVVQGKVIQKPKGILYKAKTVFLGGNPKMAVRDVVIDVFVPAVKELALNMMWIYSEKVLFGDSTRNRPMPLESRTKYNRPVQTSRVNTTWSRGGPFPNDPRDVEIIEARMFDNPSRRAHRATTKRYFNNIIVPTRAEADSVLEDMFSCLEKYQVVSVADYKELLGLETSPVDHKWGWYNLHNAEIRTVREGVLIDLPPYEDLD